MYHVGNTFILVLENGNQSTIEVISEIEPFVHQACVCVKRGSVPKCDPSSRYGVDRQNG